MDQIAGFGQVSKITMLQHLFYRYGEVNQIDLEENTSKMMGPYNPPEPLAWLIEQLEKGR